MLVWVVVGNVVASLVPTAGPALYGLATGNHARFAALVDFLGSSGSLTAGTQQYLWSLHEAGASGFGSGISAFPSMHVAIICMCALFASELNKHLRIPGAIYTGLIMLSSVYLGWHYAVDGYAAVILTVGIYWLVRRAMRTSVRTTGRLGMRREPQVPAATA
jgi:membrane-associated phospholipid phosphatase